MDTKPKPVSEMNVDEYYDYLLSLSRDEFIKVLTHDVRKAMTIVHGYTSLIQLDLEESAVTDDTLEMYVREMQKMLAKSYMYLDVGEEAYLERVRGSE